MGLRGLRRPEVVTDDVRRLKWWLQATPEYEASGRFHVMGYNSPFVPRAQQFFEVQLTLRHSSVEAAEPADTPKP